MLRSARCVACAAFVAALVVAPKARAQESPDASRWITPDERPLTPTERPFSLEAAVGFGTLVGAAGALAGYTPMRQLSLVGGVGTSFEGRLQAGLGFRLREFVLERRRRSHALVTGFGFSMGSYAPGDAERVAHYVFEGVTGPGENGERSESLDDDARRVPLARWLQLDLGYELKTRGGLTLFVGGGAAYLTNTSDCEEHGAPCDEPAPSIIPTATVSLGYSL